MVESLDDALKSLIIEVARTPRDNPGWAGEGNRMGTSLERHHIGRGAATASRRIGIFRQILELVDDRRRTNTNAAAETLFFSSFD